MSYAQTGRGRRRRSQSGAVLYIALIMLTLLALIGIVGMQVAGLQERMSASYRAVNLAFQRTEEFVRDTECGLERLNDVPDVSSTDCPLVNRAQVQTNCDDGYDPGDWVAGMSLTDAPRRNIRQIEACIIGEAEIAMGRTQEEGGGLQPVYQITTYQTDTNGGANPTSAVGIDTIFKL